MHSYYWQNVHHEGCSPQVLYLAIDFDISLVDRKLCMVLPISNKQNCRTARAFMEKHSQVKFLQAQKNAANQNPISPFGAINLSCKPIINTQQIQISTVKVN